MAKRGPSRLDEHLGYWLRCLSNFVSSTFANRLTEHDVSVAQWVVLRSLYDHEGAALGQVAQLVGVDKSTLSRMVDRLIKRGLVQRSPGVDRRSVELSLTAAGRKLVPDLAALADQNDRQFFAHLSEAERDTLLATIHRLLAANDWSHDSRGHDQLS